MIRLGVRSELIAPLTLAPSRWALDRRSEVGCHCCPKSSELPRPRVPEFTAVRVTAEE
jgi:hypothetical protein